MLESLASCCGVGVSEFRSNSHFIFKGLRFPAPKRARVGSVIFIVI